MVIHLHLLGGTLVKDNLVSLASRPFLDQDTLSEIRSEGGSWLFESSFFIITEHTMVWSCRTTSNHKLEIVDDFMMAELVQTDITQVEEGGW